MSWLVLFLGITAQAGVIPVRCGVYADVGRGSLHAFKQNLAYTVPGADNPAFIRTVRDEHRHFALYFHVENAVMKPMNDHYFLDKEVTASVVAVYEKILLKHIEADPRFQPDQIYSDYKSLRLAFKTDSPELRAHLAKAYEKTAVEFKAYLEEFPALKRLFDFEGSGIRDSARWHLGGFGPSADQAATAARFARYHKTPEGRTSPPIEDFFDPRVLADLNRKVTQAERLRARVASSFRAQDPDTAALTQMENRVHVLSPAAIEILRKVPAETADGYVRYVQDKFRIRFGLELSREVIEDMQTYFHEMEAFAPSIFETQEVLSMGLEHGADGIVAADLAGQNVRNLHVVMQAVSEAARTSANGAQAERAVILARAGQDRASFDFERRRERFADALTAAHIIGKDLPLTRSGLLFTGDDGVFFPRQPLTTPEKVALMRKLAERSVDADDFRVTFLSPTFAGSLRMLSSTERADFVSRSEATEKRLRRHLEDHGVKYDDLKTVGIAFDVQPTLGKASVKVWVTGPGAAKLRDAIEKALPDVVPEDFQVDGVEVVTPEPHASSDYSRGSITNVQVPLLVSQALALHMKYFGRSGNPGPVWLAC